MNTTTNETLGEMLDQQTVKTDRMLEALATHGRDVMVTVERQSTAFGTFVMGWSLILPEAPAPPTANPGPRPEWAQAAIVAEFHQDQSDMMTDYFATKTEQVVVLAWSKHTKDLFAEMRKAAATFEPTKHLGPGLGLFFVRVILSADIPPTNGCRYYKGSPSHWHRDLYPNGHNVPSFKTRAEAEAFIAASPAPEAISFDGFLATFEFEIVEEGIEHREKYSMGAGYYLKGSMRYSSGWIVRKTSLHYLTQRTATPQAAHA